MEPRLERTETIILNKSVLQGIEIVSRELYLSGNVSPSLLSSGPQITVGLKALFFSYLYYLLDHFVFPPPFPPFPYSSNICWPHTWCCFWHSQWECDFIAFFFFLSQQNVSQHVVMEASVLGRTNACVKKDILVLNVNKWTETSAEWPGQVFLIRSLTWHLICWI